MFILHKTKHNSITNKLIFLALCLVLAAYISACALAPAPDEPAPTTLDFSGGGDFDLSGLMRQTQLTSLNLTGRELSVEDYAALQAALPDCDIAWSVPLGAENINLILDVPLQITVELGKCKKSIKEILGFSMGSVIVLDRLAGELVDILVNGKLFARGEVVVIDDNYGVRVTDILASPQS